MNSFLFLDETRPFLRNTDTGDSFLRIRPAFNLPILKFEIALVIKKPPTYHQDEDPLARADVNKFPDAIRQ
jgi:hypothetical protein